MREYARIQTFPDDWQFRGALTSQYKQIGNAVPANMAYELGLSVVDFLNRLWGNRCATSRDTVTARIQVCLTPFRLGMLCQKTPISYRVFIVTAECISGLQYTRKGFQALFQINHGQLRLIHPFRG
ncbi:MAG: DNA cytosine methyltransferase [Thiothrix sp.]